MKPNALLALLTLTAALPAQHLEEGYQSAVHALPAGAGSFLQLTNGGLVYFTGTDLVLDHNGATRSLLQFATPVFGSFTIEVGPGRLLFGESSNGDVWSVPLTGSATPLVLANLPFNYDAVAWPPGRALVSAKTTGFGTGHNDIVALDLSSGTVTPLIQVPGASGPIALDARGNLHYATSSLAFPAPPASTDVLRWSRPRLAAALGTAILTETDATTVHAGLDAASDLAFDGDRDLFFVDWWNSQVGELSCVDGSSPRRSVLLDYASSPVSGTSLQFVGHQASQFRPAFEPFQPAGGGRLLVHESSWTGPSQVRTVQARRPVTGSPSSPVSAGTFHLTTDDGPQNGIGLVALSAAAAPAEVPVFAGFEQVLFWNPGLLVPVNTHFIQFDSGGQGILSLTSPGFATILDVHAQVAMANSRLDVIGSAPRVHLRLGR